MSGSIAVVVPSLGASPLQEEALAALRAAATVRPFALFWVHQGDREPPRLAAGEILVRLPAAVGFSRAANAGFAAAGEVDYLGVVNDDAVVERDWLAILAAALDTEPALGAVQGVNLLADSPALADGCGIGWNRGWQAIQLGHGEPAPPPDREPFEIFGVSATAALYRRAALEAVRLGAGTVFDPHLDAYYEDVDLAVRLRGRGATARCLPGARAAHAGGATAGREPLRRAARIRGNRFLVLARLAGGAWPRLLARAAARELADAVRAALRFDLPALAGQIAGGGGRSASCPATCGAARRSCRSPSSPASG